MLTAANLEMFCRICLRQLMQFGGNDQQITFKAAMLPDLANTLQHYFKIDVIQQSVLFPKSICNLCYHAVVHFQELCAVAQQSTEALTRIALGLGNDNANAQESLIKANEHLTQNEVKEEPTDKEDDETKSDNSCPTQLEATYNDLNITVSTVGTSNSTNKRKHLACHHCGKQVYKLPYLEAHIRSVHEGNPKPFLCHDCDKCFTRYEQLRSHMRNAHPTSSNNTDDNNVLEQQLICEHCNRKYSTKNALGEHLKRHAQHKPHVCEHCGVSKVTRTELVTHLRVHNPEWEKFKCNQCPQLFKHKSAISRHVRVVHEGQRRFQCTHCQKRFATHASQLRHERLHTGELPNRCKICCKCFSDSDRLNTHMRAHDRKLWPYACAYCSKPCITRQTLINHEQRHTENHAFICGNCSLDFSTEALLANHKQVACVERS